MKVCRKKNKILFYLWLCNDSRVIVTTNRKNKIVNHTKNINSAKTKNNNGMQQVADCSLKFKSPFTHLY